MPRYTLTYFDFPGGRGEAARIALHLAGADWADNRIEGHRWPQLKGDTPFGGLPTLEVEGRGTIAQSNAVLAHIGREHGLLPSDSFECARHEAVMNAVEELRAEAAITADPDEDRKKAKREAYASGYFARWLGHVSAEIRGPFVGGDALSVADLKLYVAMRSYPKGVYDHIPRDVLDPFDRITAHMAAVEAHPGVAEWLTR